MVPKRRRERNTTTVSPLRCRNSTRPRGGAIIRPP